MKPPERADGYVYCLHDETNNLCRIGKTHAGKSHRIEGQVGYYPFPLKTYKVYVFQAMDVESYLHKLFKEYKVSGSWYKITPDMFHIQMDSYKQLNQSDLLGNGIADEVKRGIRKWVIYVNDQEHDVKLIQANAHYNKHLFEHTNGKRFYVKFETSKRFRECRIKRIIEPIIILSMNRKTIITGKIYFKEVEGADELLKKYCEVEGKDNICGYM